MKQFRFRALVNIVAPSGAGRRCPNCTRELLHAWRLDAPSEGKYLPALIFADGNESLDPGSARVATITVTDDEALSYLGPGQVFTLWGSLTGRGVICRRVFTDHGPS